MYSNKLFTAPQNLRSFTCFLNGEEDMFPPNSFYILFSLFNVLNMNDNIYICMLEAINDREGESI